MNVSALCVHQGAGADFSTPSGVAGTLRREERVKAQLPTQGFINYFHLRVNEQHGPMRVREHMFYEPVTALTFRICKTVEYAVALRVFDQVI